MHMMYREIQRKLCTYNYTYPYPFLVCLEFNLAWMQT